MVVEESHALTAKIWSPSERLSKRGWNPREQFYSLHRRSETNEPYAFTTGTKWDELYSFHDWSNEPAIYQFLPPIDGTFKAMAVKVSPPEDFWDHELPTVVTFEPQLLHVKGTFHEIDRPTAYVQLDRVYGCSLPRPGERVDIPMLQRVEFTPPQD